MNLLIIDDEPLELEQLTYLVKKQYPNWNIFTAEDAVEAKQLVEQYSFPLAFVDIQLPGDSGLDFCEYLRAHGIDIEVVLITAYQDFIYAKQAIHLNVLDYLVKPVIEKELFKVMEDFLQKNTFTETKSALINKVLEIVREDYNQKLQLSDLATKVYVSPTYLSKKFTETLGIKFTDYLNHFRIQKAKQLILENPDWSLFNIAEMVGFSSQHHFSNSFKKIEGITPSQFKETSDD
ncbi:response regulator [Rossellomorea sp. KS-H15a]|uniref:response regulator transcription factor n=1 Tax=Rossellomorea sp. KS-H15a TaxID=2963940 RepID=UPI0020C5CCC9|nr:helix-turn-helix domain-containing protein [Rossellomorea sp. KS-H15a]UTE77468.1 helix-turn-helix domain-containing protein [Rossellomorea sp. KS-H15a]